MNELPHWLKPATVWLLIGAALFLGASWWQSHERATRISVRGTAIEIRRAPDGHYHWQGRIAGQPVDFLVDTGATSTAIPQRLADRLGLEPQARVRSATAGGVAIGYVALADVELEGGVRAQALRVTVLPDLAGPLLGMDVLSKLRFTQQADVLRLEPARGAP